MKRVALHQAMDISRLCGAVLHEHPDGNWYDLYWLKLPIWGYAHDLRMDAEVWSRRILFWHGKEGFMLDWIPEPQP